MAFGTSFIRLCGVLALATFVAPLGHASSAMIDEAVAKSTLFRELRGFGSKTTGGLGGQLYVVTRRDDPSPTVVGTLRFGVERLDGPTWIVFDERVFPAATKTAIYLRSTLSLRSNLTIDGRGSYVSLRRLYFLDHVDWKPIRDVWECAYEEGRKNEGGQILQLKSVKNVIITHLDFLQEYRNAIDDPGVPDFSNYTRLDTQCFGDVITIVNLRGTEDRQEYNHIWINHSDFTRCGDECIAVSNPNVAERAYLTISNNMIRRSFKGILLGNETKDTPFRIAASLYHNRFIGVVQRQPRVGAAYAHVFNNMYEDWKSSAVKAHSKSRVVVEHNVFRPITRTADSWGVDSKAIDASLWAKDNIYSIRGSFATSTFPACQSAWYYQCDVPMIDISRMSYQAARDTLRPLGGWKNVPNDVRQNQMTR